MQDHTSNQMFSSPSKMYPKSGPYSLPTPASHSPWQRPRHHERGIRRVGIIVTTAVILAYALLYFSDWQKHLQPASDDADIVLTFSEDEQGPGYEGSNVVTDKPLWQSPQKGDKKSKGEHSGVKSTGFAWREKINVLNPWKFAYPDHPAKNEPATITIVPTPDTSSPAEQEFWSTGEGESGA